MFRKTRGITLFSVWYGMVWYGMVWYGILYLNQRNTLAPTTLSWFPWRACLYRHKKRLELIIQD